MTGELDDDGFLVYSRVIITAPRQVGKTAFDLARNVQSCLMAPGRQTWYTAQSGQHASAKFREMSEDFVRSPRLSSLGRRRLSNGSEAITFRNRSAFRPHPPTADALHSKQSDSNTLDEIWHYSNLQGRQLLGAITPTFGTRRILMRQQPQLWLMSTEGTAESEFSNDLFDSARAGQVNELRTAFFDFGVPFDADPDDLDIVAKYHPGYRYLFDLATLADAKDQLKDFPGEFARGYANIRTGASERVIPKSATVAAQWPADQIPDGPICFGAAVGVDAVDTTITVSTQTPDGSTKITTIVNDGHAPGTWWALDRVKELHAKYGAPFAIDRIGPSAALHADAKRADIPLIDLDTSIVSAATQNLYTGMLNPNTPTWRYVTHPAFELAFDLATRRWIGDGAWVFGRRASHGSISPLEAAALSSVGLDYLPEERPIQLG